MSSGPSWGPCDKMGTCRLFVGLAIWPPCWPEMRTVKPATITKMIAAIHGRLNQRFLGLIPCTSDLRSISSGILPATTSTGTSTVVTVPNQPGTCYQQ